MIGKRIKELRKKKGISLTELAARSGVSKSYLSNIERDLKKNPSIDVLLKISSVLNVDPYEVIRTKDSLLLDDEWNHFIQVAEKSGIDKDRLQDLKELLEFIKWRSDRRKS